ncbi:MAG: tetratricopeptide repeat protein [Betaproteobacteria bacterium]|uniref:Tetratricopeptide repeat protein n=1 Tax=Candidatus Proximibacter danicus TaxID=2954365 RepID=A0A9D7K0Q6_9PROT|nr:tetratricopeptide repeat protein [Candidatus Proximibacter danicus]
MKSIKGAAKEAVLAALAAAMALAFSSPVLAASEQAAPKPGTKPAKTKALSSAAKASTVPAGDVSGRPLGGQAVYQVLLGEIALQRGNADLAVSAYADLGYRTRDPKVLERATEVASVGRRFDIAYETAKLWVEADPESLTARQTLVAILVVLGRAEELGPQISILLEKDKANLADNLMRLNRMLARYQDKAAVYLMMEKVVAPYEGIAEAHYALATAAFHAGERPKALVEIRKALNLRPDWELAALFEAQVLARDSAAVALASLERFLEANPGAREVRLHLARGLIAEKRYPDARKHFDRLLADNPDSPELIYPVAILALQQNDVSTAEPLLRTLLQRGEPSEKGVAAFYLGQIAEDRQAYAEAVGYYRQVASGEQYATAQIRTAQLLIKQGETLAVAQEHLQTSAKRYPPAQTQFVVAEAQLLRDAGRDEEALALLDQVNAKQPDQAEVLYDAALLAEKLGRMNIVEANLRRVIELRPDNAHAYNALGYSLAERGIRLDEARQLIAKALELAPEDPFIMDSMGWVLYRQGDLQGALTFLEKAYAIKKDAEIAAHLGEVLWVLERREEAQKIWADAAKRHPGNAELKAVRAKFVR